MTNVSNGFDKQYRSLTHEITQHLLLCNFQASPHSAHPALTRKCWFLSGWLDRRKNSSSCWSYPSRSARLLFAFRRGSISEGGSTGTGSACPCRSCTGDGAGKCSSATFAPIAERSLCSRHTSMRRNAFLGRQGLILVTSRNMSCERTLMKILTAFYIFRKIN